MNYIILGFSSSAAAVILFSTIINFFESQIPFFGSIFRYGKFGVKDKENILRKLLLDIPKSTFRHFYVLALVFFTYTFYQATLVYVFKKDVPQYLVNFLDAATGIDRKAQVSATHIYVAICLMTLQVYRRFYDTHFVSVFGKHSYINILHYGIGLFFYPGVTIALLSEAPKFAKSTKFASTEINLTELTYIDYIAIAMFLWAWWHQHVTTKILADLRKNKKGEVVTSEHKIPYGDWFEYLSSPPQTAEILMYTSIAVILAYHISWFFVYALVIANQIETMILSHWWYINTFEKFPKNRKVLIPFVY